MVGRVRVAGQPRGPDGLAGGEVQHGLDLDGGRRVEDVVQGLLVLAVLAHLPRGVRGVGAGRGVQVGRAESVRGIRY